MRYVRFYLDFVSPYVWLALRKAKVLADEHEFRFELAPVVYSALLEEHGLVGPVERPAKKEYTAIDVARCAALDGVELNPPPAHPFRSIEAGRTLLVFNSYRECLDIAVNIGNAAWVQGRDITDIEVLRECVAAAGLDESTLATAIEDPEIKQQLRDNTDQAIRNGIFGVPTFAYKGQLFWGHDRMEQLVMAVEGTLPRVLDSAHAFVDRPPGDLQKR